MMSNTLRSSGLNIILVALWYKTSSEPFTSSVSLKLKSEIEPFIETPRVGSIYSFQENASWNGMQE